MAKAAPLAKVFKARSLIKRGLTVQQVAEVLKVSPSWVYSYTKSERAAENTGGRRAAR